MGKFYTNTIEGRLAAAQDYLHGKYHSGKLTIPDMQDTAGSGDPHASDGRHMVDDTHVQLPNGKVIHTERDIA